MSEGEALDRAGFRDVDRAPDPAALVSFLDRAKGHSVLELQARLVAELRLRPGARVLDAGCGPGTQGSRWHGRRRARR
jgi:hypothetical protein